MQWFAAIQLKQLFAVYQMHLAENRNSLNSSSEQHIIGFPFCFALYEHIIAETVWSYEKSSRLFQLMLPLYCLSQKSWPADEVDMSVCYSGLNCIWVDPY